MSVQQMGPGPLGAQCLTCRYGPSAAWVSIWFCRKTWSIVAASDRACASYEPRVV